MSMSPLARLMGVEPADRSQLRRMAAAAWHKGEVACFLDLSEVRDPAVRETIRQEAERQFGRSVGNGKENQRKG